MYLQGSLSTVGVRFWVVDKGVSGGFYGGGNISFKRYDPFQSGGVVASMVPAQVHGVVGSSIGSFFVSYLGVSEGTSKAQVMTVFNPLGTQPTFAIQTINLGIIDQGSVPFVPQLNTTVQLHPGSGLALDAVWRLGKLWMVSTVNPPTGQDKNQSTAHWVRMNTTTGGIVTLDAQGDLGGESISIGTSTFYPAVAVNSVGVVAYGYSASSRTIYPGAYAALGDYPVGASELSLVVKSGVDFYNRFGTLGNLTTWGFYSSISADPSDDSFWVFNQYAEARGLTDFLGSDGIWGTVWGRLTCNNGPTAVPVSAPVPAPNPTPVSVPNEAPVTVPLPAPVTVPIPTPVTVPTPSPVQPPPGRCGLFGWGFFCWDPFPGRCGFIRRLLRLCPR